MRGARGGTAPEIGIRRDPAPTRWSYRYQRMMLTPGFRIGTRVGLPALLLAGIALAWFTNDANRDALTARIDQARDTIRHRPEFMVTGLTITGADVALAAAITDLLPLEFPLSTFDLDLGAMHLQVVALTAVRDAAVGVGPGGMLTVSVTQRRPVAVWRHTDGLRLIDADGVMTGMIAGRGDRADLPLIAGDGAKDVIGEALALFNAAAPIHERVRGLVRMGERRWDMVLDGGQRILLPTGDPVAALDRVMALHDAQDMLARDVAVVDMRNAARPTLQLAPMAAAMMRSSAIR